MMTQGPHRSLYPLLEGSFWGKLAPITYKETMDCASIDLLYDIYPFLTQHTSTSIIIESLLATTFADYNGHS